MIRVLLSLGADPSVIDIKTTKSFTLLLKEDQNESMRNLLNDCFMQAIVQNNLKTLNQFLNSGFEVNLSLHSNNLPDQNSLLHWSILFSNSETVKLLLEHGADPNYQNKHGATPFHECLALKEIDNDTLLKVEILLTYKADVSNIKGTDGVFKDQTVLNMAIVRYMEKSERDVYDLIKNFFDKSNSSSLFKTFDHSSLSNKTIVNSPVFVHKSVSPDFDAYSMKTATSPDNLEQLFNWNQTQSLNDSSSVPEEKEISASISLLWPQPQYCQILSENVEDRFDISEIKLKPINVFIKPPFAYSYMDLINRLALSFSDISFYCINTLSNCPCICINIDKTLFQNDNAYSLTVCKSKIEINAIDSTALQYAFFTFIQLCKIYAKENIPSLRVLK